MNSKIRKVLKVSAVLLCIFGIFFLIAKKSESRFAFAGFSWLDNKADAPHGDCSTCHVTHAAPGAQLGMIAGNANLCMSCHVAGGTASAKPFSNAMKAVPGDSGTSHAWNIDAVNATYGANLPSNAEMLLRIVNDTIICSTCHDQHSQDYAPFLRASNTNDELCKDCHSVRDVGLYVDDNINNRGSHPMCLYPASDSRFNATPTAPIVLTGSGVDSVGCTSCHELHYSASTDGYILRTTNDDNLCTSCHTYGSHEGMGCSKCHQSHNTNQTNIYMLRDTVETPNSGNWEVIFTAENGPNSFADADATFNGICEVCHTGTNYHLNDGSGLSHNDATNCTGCHPHNVNFEPQGGCTNCHNSTQGPRRQIVGVGGDFDRLSHHVNGVIVDADCIVCHYMGNHQAGVVKLRDPDQGTSLVYDYEVTDPDSLENFCLNCHDSDGALDGNGTTPFSDGITVPDIKAANLWNNSAHNSVGYAPNSGNPISCFGNGSTTGCHGNGHGSENIKLLSAPPGQALSDFCFNCHTDGLIQNNAVSGAALADDIEQAFSISTSHGVGTAFTIGANSFTLECTSCHNPHIATGKYWEADLDKSPVTRPDFSDPVNNPRAMGTTLWGDEAGEKMDDYAGSGKYQKPGGSSHVFDGSELPDYVSFCLDCHQYTIGSIAAKNWDSEPHGKKRAGYSGLGIDYTTAWGKYNVPDGYNLSGRALGWSGGSPNQSLESYAWPVIPKGRGYVSLTTGAYDQSERNAGVNFVLSCTDCHEAHGSDKYSLMRTSLNSKYDGTEVILSNNQNDWHGLWQGGNPEGFCWSCHSGYQLSKEHFQWHNQTGYCSACHSSHHPDHPGMGAFTCRGVCHSTEYYYGNESDPGWYTPATFHANRKALSSSTAYDAADYSPDLVLDMKFENNLKDGHMWNLHGKFVNGTGSFVSGRVGTAIQVYDNPVEIGTEKTVWNSTNEEKTGNISKVTEMKYHMTLEAWLYPTSDPSDGQERYIATKHNYWNGGYSLRLKPTSGEYRVGLQTNMGYGGPTDGWDSDQYNTNGLRGAYSTVTIPMNQWTHVAATFDWQGPVGDQDDLSVGKIRIYVNGVDVTTSDFPENTSWAQPQDPADPNRYDEAFMTSYTEINVKYPGRCSWCATAFSVAGINWSDADNNFVGRLDEVKLWNITKDANYFNSLIPPVITKVEGAAGFDRLNVTFAEPAYANTDGTGNLQPSDFTLTDSDNGRTITNVDHTAGNNTARLTLSTAFDNSNDVGTDELAAASNSIYDISGGAPSFTDAITISAMPSPFISSVEGSVGSANLQLTFSDFVFTNDDSTGALQPADFILTDNDNGRTITSIDHTVGANNAILILSSALDNSDDIGVDELVAAGGSIFNPEGYPVPTDSILPIAGQVADSIIAVTGAVGYDILEVRFSGAVYTDPGKSGTLQPADFILTDIDNLRTIIAVDHTLGVESQFEGEDIVMLTLSSALDGTDDIDVDMLAPVDVYNYLDNPVNTTPDTIRDMPVTLIDTVEGSVGSTKIIVTFSHWVFANNDATGNLQPSDFVLTDVNADNARTIDAVQHTSGGQFAILTMSAPLISADIGVDLVAAASVSIFNSAGHPVPTSAVVIAGLPVPHITSVEGTIGLDNLLVFFDKGVYTNPGQTGALEAGDFTLTDIDNSRAILSVEHEAGTAAAILTLSSAMDAGNDINVDELAAVNNAIYNKIDVAVETGSLTITGNDCPVGGTRFDFNEGALSDTVTDNTGLLIGTVGNPAFSMKGDGLYTGDSTEAVMTYIDVNNNDLCMKSPRALTLESRFFMGDMDLDYVDIVPENDIDDDYDAGGPFSKDGDGRNTTASRIAERKRTFQFTVFRSNWSGDEIESRVEKGRVIFKYRVTDRGYCDGTYPGDPTIGNGSWMKQISSDGDLYPISTGHWYQVKIVFNTDKARLAVDIFADDQGTDGSNTGELWPGYKNITRTDPEESAGCKWAAIPGLEMATEDRFFHIGDNPTHKRPGQDDQGDYRNAMLKGKIDWFIWKPVVDYSGVDDPPFE